MVQARSGIRWRVILVTVMLLGFLTGCGANQSITTDGVTTAGMTTVPPFKPNGLFDDSRITIHSAADVEQKRQAAIHYLWGNAGFPSQKLPTGYKPDVCATADGAALPASDICGFTNQTPGVARVDELRTAMDGKYEGLAYHIIPARPNGKLVIENPGHSCLIGDDPNHYRDQETIQALVQNGYAVLATYMPTYRPDRQNPCGKPSDLDIISDPNVVGSPLKYYLELIAVPLNYVQTQASAGHFPQYTEFDMVGLSGGGWTTTLYAAIDPRIRTSIPVAGSEPLYIRVGGSIGTPEQWKPSFYSLFGYPDLYVMGGYGAGRRQIQVLNRHDDCCFGQNEFDATRGLGTYDQALRRYEGQVRDTLYSLGSGRFQLIIDEQADRHEISPFALDNVILPELNAGGPARYNATFVKSNADQPAVWGWAKSDFDTKEHQMEQAGYRLLSLSAFVLPGNQDRYNAVWAKSTEDRPAVWGWTSSDLKARDAQLEAQGYRLMMIDGFVLDHDQDRYNAIWGKSTEDRPAVWGWTSKDLKARDVQLEAQGYHLLDTNGFTFSGNQDRYNAVWSKSVDHRPAVWGWNPTDFAKQVQTLAGQGYHLVEVNSFVFSGDQVRYNGLWSHDSHVTTAAVWGWASTDFNDYEPEIKAHGYRLSDINAIALSS